MADAPHGVSGPARVVGRCRRRTRRVGRPSCPVQPEHDVRDVRIKRAARPDHLGAGRPRRRGARRSRGACDRLPRPARHHHGRRARHRWRQRHQPRLRPRPSHPHARIDRGPHRRPPHRVARRWWLPQSRRHRRGHRRGRDPLRPGAQAAQQSVRDARPATDRPSLSAQAWRQRRRRRLARPHGYRRRQAAEDDRRRHRPSRVADPRQVAMSAIGRRHPEHQPLQHRQAILRDRSASGPAIRYLENAVRAERGRAVRPAAAR